MRDSTKIRRRKKTYIPKIDAVRKKYSLRSDFFSHFGGKKGLSELQETTRNYKKKTYIPKIDAVRKK